MNQRTITIVLFLLSAFYGYSQVKSGIIFSGGKGSLSNVVFPDRYVINDDILCENMQWNYEYKFDVRIGYKIRLEPQSKPFFYDIDLNVGLKRFNTNFTGTYNVYIPKDNSNEEENVVGFSSGNFGHTYYSLSVNPSWNYRLIRGLYAGAGIEPTWYKGDIPGSKKWKFDLPLTAKVGYDLKFIDFSISYKYGLFDAIQSEYLKSAKSRNWQISVFIPF